MPGSPSGQAWTQAVAADLEVRIRHLVGERRLAYRRVQAIRHGGHLVPGSLNEEIVDIEAALEQALSRYGKLPRSQSAGNGLDPSKSL